MVAQHVTPHDGRCQTCVHWHRGDDHHGACRRNPPTVLPTNDNVADEIWYVGVWPMTREIDWCGEYDPEEPECFGVQ